MLVCRSKRKNKSLYLGVFKRPSGTTGRQRRRLWLHNPHCHWCGRTTVLEGRLTKKGKPTNFPHTATVDHMKSRLQGRQPGESTRIVLACDTCNHSRATLEAREHNRAIGRGKQNMPVEWLRLFRSGLDGDGI